MSVLIRMSDGTVLKAAMGKSWAFSESSPWIHVYDNDGVHTGSFNALEVDGIHLEGSYEVVEDDDGD